MTRQHDEPLLRVEGLRLAIGRVKILRDVSITVHPGESVGIVGPNGAGKTTLLRCLSGHYPAAEATVGTYAGAALPRNISGAASRSMIHVPEGRGLIASLTVEENIRAACYAVGKRWDRSRRAELVEMFPILEKRGSSAAGNLSGGEQQLVAIARAVAVEPRLLLIDEMSLGLAPAAIAEVVRVLNQVAAGSEMSLLVVDQNIRTVTDLCSRVYGLEHGQTSEYTDSANLVQDAIRDVYLF